MRIRHIELDNFLSHEHEVLSLPEEGVFFLDAPSGFGKSSLIIDAPLYALFGPRATRGKQEDLRHLDYPDEAMRCQVVFEFDDGQKLVLERGVNERGNPYATAIDEDGKILAEGPKAVDKYIRRQRLGGMSWQQLLAAFVCHQEEVTALTKLPSAERKKLIHRLLGIRELEVSQEEIKDRLRKARAELTRVSDRLGERTKESEQARVEAATVALKTAEQELKEVERVLSERRRHLEEVTKELAPLRSALEAQDATGALELEIERRRLGLDDARSKLVKHQEATSLLAGAEKLQERLTAARVAQEEVEALGQRTRQHVEAAGKLQEAQAALEKAQANVPKPTERTPAEAKARLQSIAGELTLVAEERQNRAHELEHLEADGICFTCQRELPEGAEREEVLAKVQATLASLDERQTALKTEKAVLETELPDLEQAAKAQQEAERAVAQAEGALNQAQTQLDTLTAQGVGDVQELRDQFKERRDAVRTLEKEEHELEAARKDLDPKLPAAVKELEEAQAADELKLAAAKAQAAVTVDRAQLVTLQERESEMKTEIARLEGQEPMLKSSVTRTEQELTAAQEEFERFRELLDERETRNTRVLRLEALADYLDAFTRHLAAEIRPAIEEMATEMLYQMSNGEFIAVAIDVDYNILIQREEGNWIKPESISGGEKARANLCLRLALTRLVSQRTGVPVQFIVLDEPFGNLDPDLIDVSLSLLDTLRSFYPQIFLISHTGDLASSQHVDYRIGFDAKRGRGRVALYQR
jgi:exonuclease SbcC